MTGREGRADLFQFLRGRFRSDLYARLSGFAIPVPPLRDRPGDIEPLAQHFAKELSRGGVVGPEALDVLKAYAWPGNVRELRNAIERALVLSSGARIEPHHLPERLLERYAGDSGHRPQIDVRARVAHYTARAAARLAGSTESEFPEVLAWRRTFARIDVSSRSLFALIEPDSCFTGTLAEFAFAADRTYMASLPASEEDEPAITLTEVNFGLLPMVTDQSRLARRFYENAEELDAVRATIGRQVRPDEAERLGLVTAAVDDLDWPDEIRIAIEERAAMSPDALTGMEANLRFNGRETMNTRIFGRLSAWQNWIFIRPNAVGEKGALKVYGKGNKAQFDLNRV